MSITELGSVDKWKVTNVHHLFHRNVIIIQISNDEGYNIQVSIADDDLERGSKTAHASTYSIDPEELAKESPQTEESIVGAGTDFLIKVTEEAVITGMMLVNGQRSHLREDNVRDTYRDAAEDITLEELKRFTSNDPHREEAPDDEADDVAAYRAAHGIPDPYWISKPKVPPARSDPGAVFFEEEELRPMGSDAEFVRYLDATQGK